MAATSLSRTQPHLRNSSPSRIECSGGQLIVFTPLPVALYTGKPHYHPFPPSSNTAIGQLPPPPHLVCAASKFNLATARIPESVPTWDQGPSADDHRILLQGSSQATHLTSWLCPAVNSAKDLPLDSLCHEVWNHIAEIPILALASTDLVSLPLLREPSITYQALRTPLIQSLLAD